VLTGDLVEAAAPEQLGANNFLIRLRNRTEAAHIKLEDGIGFSKRTMSEAGVCRFLERMHGFFRAWEPWVAASAIDPGLFGPRRKLGLIEADLRRLGSTDLGNLPAYPMPFDPATPENVMGSLYVIEGSTLGGLVIRKWLKDAPWMPDGGFAYFYSYGREAPAMWRAFQDILVGFATPTNADAIIEAANDTYARIYHWHCHAEG
jgi:heme oxygenase